MQYFESFKYAILGGIVKILDLLEYSKYVECFLYAKNSKYSKYLNHRGCQFLELIQYLQHLKHLQYRLLNLNKI